MTRAFDPVGARGVLFGITILVAIGCGRGSGLERASVSGNVTLNGQPVQAGTIRFVCLDGGPTSGAAIQNGAYSIPTAKGPALGRHRVEISVPQKSGRKIVSPFAYAQPQAGKSNGAATEGENQGGANLNPMQATPSMDEWVDMAPAAYNKESTLEVQIESGDNTFNVDMK